MVFLFFENIQRTPSPGFAPCQSPSGGVPTSHENAATSPGNGEPIQTIHPRTKAPGNGYKRHTMQAGHNDTNNQTTHAAGHDERRTQCTHAHERHKPGTRSQAFKACHVHPGRLFLIIFYVYRAAVHARKSPGYMPGL